jgi:hypothetical protein
VARGGIAAAGVSACVMKVRLSNLLDVLHNPALRLSRNRFRVEGGAARSRRMPLNSESSQEFSGFGDTNLLRGWVRAQSEPNTRTSKPQGYAVR